MTIPIDILASQHANASQLTLPSQRDYRSATDCNVPKGVIDASLDGEVGGGGGFRIYTRCRRSATTARGASKSGRGSLPTHRSYICGLAERAAGGGGEGWHTHPQQATRKKEPVKPAQQLSTQNRPWPTTASEPKWSHGRQAKRDKH